MDAKEFTEKLPGRVNKVMDALAEGQITLNVQGIDEKELMRGIQKLANRVTSGLIIAALIVGAAMMMRIDTETKLFGYPPSPSCASSPRPPLGCGSSSPAFCTICRNVVAADRLRNGVEP